MKRFYIRTFGCRVNEAESEKISLSLMRAGFEFSPSSPDFYLINSCAVTLKAEREVRQHIYQIARKFPQAKIILTGCAAAIWPQSNKIIKGVTQLIINKNKDQLLRELMERPSATGKINAIFNKYLDCGRAIFKIQDGCHYFCSYCLTAYLRGKPRSEFIKDLVYKINHYPLSLNEVILAAINTAAYGVDTGENFTQLLEAILSQTTISRLSLGSVHPLSFTTDFLAYYNNLSQNPRFVQFFHIPLQSGAETVLELMRRGYKPKYLQEIIYYLKKINPFIFIGTDIIVGFLGESDREFAQTYTFLEKTPVDKLHVFRFSLRPKTTAYLLRKNLSAPSETIKTRRAKAINTLGQKKYQQFLQLNLKRKTTAFIISKDKNGFYRGLLDNQLPILVKSSKDIQGQFKAVKVESLSNNQLLGVLLD